MAEKVNLDPPMTRGEENAPLRCVFVSGCPKVGCGLPIASCATRYGSFRPLCRPVRPV